MTKRTYTAEQRDIYAQKGIALPDGSYALPDKAALTDAIRHFKASEANNESATVKKHIIARAKALGATSVLPADWSAAAESSEYTNLDGRFYAQETMHAAEVVWSDNAEGLPEADIVIMRPGEGGNRRMYSPEVLRAAAETDFFGGVPMFIDHGSDPRMPRKRSFSSLFGTVKKGTSYVGKENELRAHATFIDPELTKKVRAAQETAPDVVGLSAVHEFMGQRYRGTDGHYHERVDKFAIPHSVDVVLYPAQGGGIANFLPAHESEDDVDWSQVTEESLAAERPDLVAAIRNSAANAGDASDAQNKDDKATAPASESEAQYVTKEQAQLLAQEAADTATKKYEERTKAQAETRASVSAHLAKSGLPEAVKARLATQFDGQVEYIEKTVQEAIDSAASEAKAYGWHGPKVEGLGASAAPNSDDSTARDPSYVAFEQSVAFVPKTGRNAVKSEAN